MNRLLDRAGFGAFVDARCAPFYAAGIGRPERRAARKATATLLGALIERTLGASTTA